MNLTVSAKELNAEADRYSNLSDEAIDGQAPAHAALYGMASGLIGAAAAIVEQAALVLEHKDES